MPDFDLVVIGSGTGNEVAAAAGLESALVHALTATPVWYVVAWSDPGILVVRLVLGVELLA